MPLHKRTYYLLLSLIGLLIYLNSFSNSFVWDDEVLIVGNGYIRSFANIIKIFTSDIFHWTTSSNFYRPLFSLSLMFDFSLWQLNPFGYHLSNLTLHILNSCLVFYLLNLLTSSKRISFIASLFFLVHPAQTQAVTYISGRADPLACFFMLSAVIFFAQAAKRENNKENILFLLAMICFVFALISKEIALVLPLLLISYDYGFGNIRQNLKVHITFISIALLYIVLRNQWLPFSAGEMLPFNLWVRLLNLPKVIIFYLVLLVLPWNLHIERSFSLSSYFDFPVFLSLVVLLIILIWIFRNRQNKIILFSFFWFVINLFPVINIILPLNAVVSEHWVYLASVGFFIILAMGFEKLLSQGILIGKLRLSSRFHSTILGIILSALALLTIARNFEWRNPIILFENTLKLNNDPNDPRIVRIHFNLGHAYLKQGFCDKAIAEFNQALKSPTSFNPRRIEGQLGSAYLNKNAYQEAEEHLLKALELDPEYILAYFYLAHAYKKAGKLDKAREIRNKALQLKPLHPRDQLLIKIIADDKP